MKTIKILAIIILLIIVVLVNGCQKCETCTETQVTKLNVPTPGYPQTTSVTYEACGKTLKELDGRVIEVQSTSGNITATVTTSIICY